MCSATGHAPKGRVSLRPQQVRDRAQSPFAEEETRRHLPVCDEQTAEQVHGTCFPEAHSYP